MNSSRSAILFLVASSFLATAWGQPGIPANSVIGYPGAGVLQVGDLWDSYLPQGFGPFYSEQGSAPTEGIRQFLRMGNFDRQWTTPNAHWPRAFPWTIFWGHYMLAQCYDPDPNFNPTKKGVAPPATGNHAQVTFQHSLPGANDPDRRYAYEPYFVDGNRRQHAVYEAGWPTNVGLDVRLRVHALAGPNWGHFNDFIIMEIEFKNTGVRDMNLDGVADALQSSADIKALTLLMSGEAYMSVSMYNTGVRYQNSISTRYTRMGGWIDDPDPDGYPWAFAAYYAGTKDQVPLPGARNMGMNAPTQGSYTDIWNGWVWLDVKNGRLPADASKTTSPLPNAPNIFGVHPVGVGPERGWYISTGSGGALSGSSGYADPKRNHQLASGTFLKNGGSTRSISQLDDGPDPNFFASGTQGDVTSFVKKATPARPRGDQKILGTFSQTPWEDGTGYPTGWGRWTQGYNYAHEFDGDLYTGIGPISIPVGESRTFVIAMVAGYRLEGIQKAVHAARYTYANDFDIPLLPPVPEISINPVFPAAFSVEWDNRAEADPEFQGYKIWKSVRASKRSWLEEGMRLSDRYQEQMSPTEDITPLKKPSNPQFDAFTEVENSTTGGEYLPDTWGTWELVKVVPGADLAQYGGASQGYDYVYRDTKATFDSPCWYYVSSYKEGAYSGTGGEMTNRIETAALNMNGATGLWMETYPYAPHNANYPRTLQGLKNIGAAVTLLRPVAYDTLSIGTVTVGSDRVFDIRVRNSTRDTMRVDVTSTNSAFVPEVTSLSVPPRDSLGMYIMFVPSHVGPDTGRFLFAIQSDPNPYSLFLTGTGLSGTVAPALTWQDVQRRPANNLYGAYVAMDGSGTTYSASMVWTNIRLWDVRRHGPNGETQWSVSDTSFGSFPALIGFTTDGTGNLYLGLNAAETTIPSAGGMSVAKVSTSGQVQWFRSVGQPDNNLITLAGFEVDNAGNALVTGITAGTTGINSRITTAKISSDGTVQWVAHHDGPAAPSDSGDIGRAVAADSLGNVYVTGQTRSLNSDIATVKYSGAGEFQWVSYYDGPSSFVDNGKAVAATPTGDIYVLGQSAGPQGDQDIVLLKYRASDGFLLWSNRYDGDAHLIDDGSSLLIADDGRIYVAGSTQSSSGFTDGILLVYSPEGTRQTLIQYDGTRRTNDAFGSLRQDAGGNLYVGGSSVGALGLYEPILLKFDSQGSLEWEAHYEAESVGDSWLTSLSVAGSGKIAIGGNTRVGTSAEYNMFVATYGEKPVSVSEREPEVPTSSSLMQNFPNPFNPRTGIRYQVSAVSDVKLVVYDILGRTVATLVNERKSPGSYQVEFDGSYLASGVYFYRMQAGGFTQTRKLCLQK